MNIVTRSIASSTAMMVGLLLGAGVAFAQTVDTPPPSGDTTHHKMQERCKADPQKCEAMKKQRMEEHRAACEKDPAACKQKREERHAKMKAECEKDPAACKQKREEMRQKHEEKCKADPQKCEAMKQRHHKHGDQPMPDKPIEAPPAPATPSAAK